MSSDGRDYASGSNGRTPRAQKRSEVVARAIIDDMSRREPGEPIGPEQQLLERYGVARNTLREALRLLEVFGLITIKPGSGGGPVVKRVGPRDFGNVATLYFRLNGYTFYDLLEARRELETSLVRAVANSAKCEEIGQLLLDSEEKAEVPGSPEQWIPLHAAFHRLLLEHCGVPMLGFYGAALQEIHTDWARAWRHPPEQRDAIERSHRKIAEAIKRGDAKRAGDMMYEHLSDFFERDQALMPGLLGHIVDWRS